VDFGTGVADAGGGVRTGVDVPVAWDVGLAVGLTPTVRIGVGACVTVTWRVGVGVGLVGVVAAPFAERYVLPSIAGPASPNVTEIDRVHHQPATVRFTGVVSTMK
jgi:hypothetical protein